MRMALLIGLIAGVAYGCTADGVVINSIGGAPVAHAQVIANTKEMRGASTDAAGKWTIADLPCEVVRFSVQHAGFLGDPKKPDTPALLPAHDLTVSLMPESAISG